MPSALVFTLFALGWSALAGFLLSSETVHPLAIFAVWIIGFVWVSGWISSGAKDADRLTLTWLGILGGFTLFGAVAVGLITILGY